MKKIFLIALVTILLIRGANASIPLLPPPGPGGGIMDVMRAQQDLRRQYVETQILQQQLALMQQQRMQQSQVYDAPYKNTNPANYNDVKISYILENNALGQSTSWWDPNTGIKYTITPKNNTTYRGNQNCRTYRVTIQSNMKKKLIDNLACRLNNGTWIRIEKK